jgi:hypothetical protein
MIAFRADIFIALNIGPVKHSVTLNAFLPQAFRYTAGALADRFTAHTGWQNFVYPAHGLPRHPYYEGVIINAVRLN